MLITENYLGNGIQFEVRNGEVFANATAMCKAFGKESQRWLRLKSVRDYVEAMEKRSPESGVRLIEVKQGGVDQGTWIHEKLIVFLGRWLNLDFAVWCDERIAELMKHGVTATPAMAEAMLNNPEIIRDAMTALIDERKRVAELAPKAEYADKVLTANNSMLTTMVAKQYGLSAYALNDILHELGIQYKRDGQWFLYAKYDGQGYVETDTMLIERSSGVVETKHFTKWTEKGRKLIHDLLTENGLV